MENVVSYMLYLSLVCQVVSLISIMIINIKEPIEFNEISIDEQSQQLFRLMGRDEITDMDFCILKHMLKILKDKYPNEFEESFKTYVEKLRVLIEGEQGYCKNAIFTLNPIYIVAGLEELINTGNTECYIYDNLLKNV